MDKDQFDAWFAKFNKPYGGIKPPKKWFDTVVENHKQLRDMIGGSFKVVEVKMDNYQSPAKYDDVQPEVAELCGKIPHYFWDNNIKPEDMTLPVVQRGPQEGMKWGRHIEHWRKKNAGHVDKDDISKILGRLGEKWAKCKTAKQKLYATMTVEPAAFAALGHYPSDISLISGKMSCWCQGGCSQNEKYRVSVYKNSFVLLVSVNPFKEDFSDLDVESRVWGVPNKNLDAFHLSNFYFKAQVKGKGLEAVPMGNVHNAWKVFFEDLIGGPVDKTTELFTFTNVYKNAQGTITYHRKGVECAPMQVRFQYDEIANGGERCRYCRREEDDLNNIDDRLVCNRCMPQVPRCALTNEQTFNTAVAYHPETKAVVYIKTSFTEGRNAEYVLCGVSGYYATKAMMVKTTNYAGGYNAAIPSLEQRGYEKCEDCGLWEVLENSYGSKKQTKCYNCRIQAAKKAAQEPKASTNDNAKSTTNTTYVKLKGFARRDEYGRFVPHDLYGNNDD